MVYGLLLLPLPVNCPTTRTRVDVSRINAPCLSSRSTVSWSSEIRRAVCTSVVEADVSVWPRCFLAVCLQLCCVRSLIDIYFTISPTFRALKEPRRVVDRRGLSNWTDHSTAGALRRLGRSIPCVMQVLSTATCRRRPASPLRGAPWRACTRSCPLPPSLPRTRRRRSRE